MSAELSTSARLRQTQGALAASQADLTRVETERDAWKATADQIVGDIRKADEQIAIVERERDEALDDRDFVERELAEMREARDTARTNLRTIGDLLAAARLEIDQLRAERDTAWELAGQPHREEPTT